MIGLNTQKLHDIAQTHIAEFVISSDHGKFVLILGSQSSPILVALGNFLYTCFQKKKCLSSGLHKTKLLDKHIVYPVSSPLREKKK